MQAWVLNKRVHDVRVLRILIARSAEAALTLHIAVAKRCGAENTSSIKGGATEESPDFTTEHHAGGPNLLPGGPVQQIVGSIFPADADGFVLICFNKVRRRSKIKIALIRIHLTRP